MSLSMWNADFTLAMDWGQDPDFQNYQFDDPKSVSFENDVCLHDNLKGIVPSSETSSLETVTENALDTDWMESDLSLFFEQLTKGQGQVDMGSFTGQPTNLGQLEGQDISFGNKSNDVIVSFPDVSIPFSDESKEVPLVTEALGYSGQDVVLTPPESPEQVTPEISLELNSDGLVSNVLPDSTAQDSYGSGIDIFGQGLGFDFHLEPTEDEKVNGEVQDFLMSPVSLSSGPSSPESSTSCSTSQLIQSSPELYKVIATPPVSIRFSPYPQEPKNCKKAKSSRGKDIVEPVSDEYIQSGIVNKKDRKKLQNKNAATRYRIKKKEEAKGLKGEVGELEERNTSLKTKVEDLQREIKYMKDLIEDVCKAKGLVPTFRTEGEGCVN